MPIAVQDYAKTAATEMQPTRNKIPVTTFDAAEPSPSPQRSADPRFIHQQSSRHVAKGNGPHFNDDVFRM
jgi:hypothetical protein